MQEWKVLFAGSSPEPESDFELAFTDVKSILGDYLGIKEEVVDKLRELIDEKDNFHLIVNIKNVSPPEERKDLSNLEIAWIILCLDKKDLPFGFLFMGGVLVGIWPTEYATAVKEDENLLNGVLGAILTRPEMWKRVDVVLPIEKEEETEGREE